MARENILGRKVSGKQVSIQPLRFHVHQVGVHTPLRDVRSQLIVTEYDCPTFGVSRVAKCRKTFGLRSNPALPDVGFLQKKDCGRSQRDKREQVRLDNPTVPAVELMNREARH